MHLGGIMKNKYIVDEPMILIDAIVNKLEYTHKKAKSLLTNEQVYVNNRIVTKYNYALKLKDEVIIKSFNSNAISNVKILFEDKNIIVVEKPHNLLTISTTDEKEKTLYHIVSDYLKERNKNARIFVIHRLDKETSGIIMFAKNEKIKKLYQDNWNDLIRYRGYAAVVEGIMPKKEDTITLNLQENDNMKVYVNKTGKEAITSYKVMKKNKDYSLLDVDIKTGRKNQIRVTMEYLKHPIIGDKKYSSKNNSLKRLALHAYKLIIKNPLTNKIDKYEIEIPKSFYYIVK